MKAKLMMIAGLVSSLVTTAVNAAVVTDTSAFDIGLGFNNGIWTSQETPTVNDPDTVSNINSVPFVVGDFTITITATSASIGSQGPHFGESGLTRVLGDYGVGDVSSFAQSTTSSLSITATYTGPALPGGAYDDSFQLTLDQVSIYAIKHPAWAGGADFYITETTGANPGASSTTTLTTNPNYNTGSAYTHIVWNPGDFAINGGTSSTRTFTFANAADLFAVDGIEIIGSAVRTYNIPESASLAILALGAAALLGRRRS